MNKHDSNSKSKAKVKNNRKKYIFKTASFVKLITEIIKNICEIVKNLKK